MSAEDPVVPRGAVLDEISHKLGELSGYVHEHRHGVNNMSAKLDALALDITKRVEALDTKMTVRMDEMDRALRSELTANNIALKAELAAANLRIVELEKAKSQHDGAAGVVSAILKSPAIGWLVGAVISGWAILTGKVHL